MMMLGQESQDERSTRMRTVKGKEDVPSTACTINQLPEQIMDCIFNRLDKSDDRSAASQVCKMWQRTDGQTRKMVYISNCYSIAPSDLSRRFKNLEKIKIKGKPRAYEFGLLVENWGGHAGPWIEEIVKAYPKLQVLHLRRMDVTDEDLKLLAMKCTKLQVFPSRDLLLGLFNSNDEPVIDKFFTRVSSLELKIPAPLISCIYFGHRCVIVNFFAQMCVIVSLHKMQAGLYPSLFLELGYK